jgi:hypothetical protein
MPISGPNHENCFSGALKITSEQQEAWYCRGKSTKQYSIFPGSEVFDRAVCAYLRFPVQEESIFVIHLHVLTTPKVSYNLHSLFFSSKRNINL